ncbi:MAG TPA: YajG family lipoprotein [Methylococcus sp.]|nr:YajG family lipoprotein [Methylococcus sp.]
MKEKSVLPVLALFLLSACSTTKVPLNYAPDGAQTKAPENAKPVAVGSFADDRGEPPTWLGAIRGGFGNPLKNLEAEKPVSDLVKEAVTEGLKARGYPVAASGALREINGRIKQLDCNQIVRREANTEIEIEIFDAQNGQQRTARTFSASNVDGSLLSPSTGIFASVEDLRSITEKTLREVVDKALDDPAVRNALK